GVNLADNLMLGRYAEASLSGVTAVNQIQFVYQNILIGISDGLVIIASQYWGARRIEPIKQVAAVAMRTALVFMAILFVVVSVFPVWVVRLFTNDTAIVDEGVKYLRVVRFTYPLFCVTTILLALLRCTEVVKIAFWLSLSTLGINIVINWFLIYGNCGFPAMGVEGAAIATVIARIVEIIILFIFLRNKEHKLNLKIKDFLYIDKEISHDYYKVCTPIIVAQSLWGINNAVQTAILGHLSSSSIAANSMASNLYLIVKTVAIGAASATNVTIGKLIGEGNKEKIRFYAKTLQIIFVLMGVICGLILFALTEPVLALYSFSDESRLLARSFLHILCFVMVGMSYQMPVNAGIIKGGGSTKYCLILDLISIWGIVIPVSFVAAFVLHASPLIVVCCLNMDQIFKCVPAFITVNYGNWCKKLTR
ncbi:MAG: MATE family efflux transporter, partial [Eubacteriales bacterium]|nr:MATE family efflux transporter [Eubacteriales bacterium]